MSEPEAPATGMPEADERDHYKVSRHASNKMTLRLGLLAEARCKELIDAFGDCGKGRSISILWACKKAYNISQDCIHEYVNDKNLELLKKRWVDGGRERKPDWNKLLEGMDTGPWPANEAMRAEREAQRAKEQEKASATEAQHVSVALS